MMGVTLDHAVDLGCLSAIEQRVLWLAVRMVDYANRERPQGDALKVGGHQASSASMVSLMTALYIHDLTAADRVSVKPHAAPVLHALEYLLGRLDSSYLMRLRDFRGLQSYPSRTKDPFPVDFSTGSVGLGSAAPLFGALADRFIESRIGASTGGRFISLLGDAELDEGNIWEAIAEPLTRSLGNVLWIVDLNRQSLDRVIPGIRAAELESHFRASDWEVIELKYGRRLRAIRGTAGGDLLLRQIDDMPNERYQSLFGAGEDVVREALLDGLDDTDRRQMRSFLDAHGGDVRPLVQDLGGHDLADILDALSSARESGDRPTVIFAYTIKGFGLEIAGRPHNHSALLTESQIAELRRRCGLTEADEWSRFAPGSREQELIDRAAARVDRGTRPDCRRVEIPSTLPSRPLATTSTQAAFGHILLDLARLDGVGERLVTVAPDVSSSTNLGGFINKVGVWGHLEEPVYDPMEDSPLKWRVSPRGQHIEIGIAEMNLVLLLGQLGLSWDSHGELMFPIGTLYDPFVMRALEGIVYSTYSGSRFVLAGTPSGISLSREGGAHQSITTPGIGIETPGLTYAEPCYARELEWLLLDALDRMNEPDSESLYLRLSTKPVDQAPFLAAAEQAGETKLRHDVVSGGFRLREPGRGGEPVVVVCCGAIVPEALQAAARLAEEEGVDATVLCLSSPDRVYRDWQAAVTAPLRGALAGPSHIESLLTPEERGAPVVTVIDGASHALSFVGSALRTRTVCLGVDRFGQTGSQPEVYAEYGIDAESIVVGCLAALEPD
jgi:pyruvate dehydrogenase E1 component